MMHIPGVGPVASPECRFAGCHEPVTRFFRMNTCGCPTRYCPFHADYVPLKLGGLLSCSGAYGFHDHPPVTGQHLIEVTGVIENGWVVPK